MSAPEQIRSGQVAALLVVEAHAVAVEPLDKAVDHHVGNGQLLEDRLEAARVAQLVGDDDKEAVDAAIDEQADEVGVVVGAVVGVGDEQQVSPLAAGYLEGAGKRREEARLDVGHDEAERLGVLRDKAARDLVGDVALLARDLLDAGAALGADLARPVVEHERYGGGRKAHLARYVLERDLGHANPFGGWDKRDGGFCPN